MGFKGNYENIHMQQTHNWIGNYCKTYFASPLFPTVRVTPGAICLYHFPNSYRSGTRWEGLPFQGQSLQE